MTHEDCNKPNILFYKPEQLLHLIYIPLKHRLSFYYKD